MMSRKLTLLVALMTVLGVVAVGAATTHAQEVVYTQYTVQPGDNLTNLALVFCTTVEDIYNANRLTIGFNRNDITRGQVLNIPNGCIPVIQPTPPPPVASPPIFDPGFGGGASNVVIDRGANLRARGGVVNGLYLIAPGDWLDFIAFRFGTTTAALTQANGLINPNRIFAGTYLIVPGLTGNSPGVSFPVGQPDTDRDGVPDEVDACPFNGNLGLGIFSNGCPVTG